MRASAKITLRHGVKKVGPERYQLLKGVFVCLHEPERRNSLRVFCSVQVETVRYLP